ncbi:hypothetical protein Ntsu_48470 [Nocardia sp. IFM 10818]
MGPLDTPRPVRPDRMVVRAALPRDTAPDTVAEDCAAPEACAAALPADRAAALPGDRAADAPGDCAAGSGAVALAPQVSQYPSAAMVPVQPAVSVQFMVASPIVAR